MKISQIILMKTVFLDSITTSSKKESLYILVICLISRTESQQFEKLESNMELSLLSMQLWKIYRKNSRKNGMLIPIKHQIYKLMILNIMLNVLKIKPLILKTLPVTDQSILNLRNTLNFKLLKIKNFQVTKESTSLKTIHTIRWQLTNWLR